MPSSSFAERFRIALSGESPHSFAKRTDLPDSTIRKYLAGTMPGLDKLLVLADATNVTLDWLAAERGPMRPEEKAQSLTLVGAEGELQDGFVAVPRLEVRPSAGAGRLVVQEEGHGASDVVAFREEWLRRIGVSPRHARLMVAQGDSMCETINDGDLMLVDVSIRDVVDGGIYVIVYAGYLKVKRIQMLRTGSLLLKSDNPRYETEEVPPHDVPDLIIEGRVRWAGGSI